MWNQVYDPFNNIWLSALVAAFPILLFVVLLTVLKVKGHIAGIITAIVAGLVAILVYSMPISKTVWTGIYGILAGTITLVVLYIYLKPKQEESVSTLVKAWSPFIFLTLLVIVFSKITFQSLIIKFSIPTVDGLINKIPPVVSDTTPFDTSFNLDLLSSTTSAIVYASIIIFKIKGNIIKSAFVETIKLLVIPINTICADWRILNGISCK